MVIFHSKSVWNASRHVQMYFSSLLIAVLTTTIFVQYVQSVAHQMSGLSHGVSWAAESNAPRVNNFYFFFAGCLKRRVLSFILLLASLVAILFIFRSVVFSPHPRVVVSGERYGSTSRPDIDTLTQTLTVRLSGMLDTSPFMFIYFNMCYPSHLLCFASNHPEICDRCLVYSLMFTV